MPQLKGAYMRLDQSVVEKITPRINPFISDMDFDPTSAKEHMVEIEHTSRAIKQQIGASFERSNTEVDGSVGCMGAR